MDLERLVVALAKTPSAPVTKQFAIGSVLAQRSLTEPDAALSLLELLAYVGDVLSAEQDQIAGDAFVETAYHPEDARVVIHFGIDLRPVAFVVVDESHVFVVVVGSETGDSTVRFGDDERGRRPPAGLEHVSATYRHGDGATGNIQLRGFPLRPPLAVITLRRHGMRRCQIVR